MNVLVTGGTGTVGRRCVARLVRAGHSVRVIGLDENLEIDGTEFRRCDITDYKAAAAHLPPVVRSLFGPDLNRASLLCLACSFWVAWA